MWLCPNFHHDGHKLAAGSTKCIRRMKLVTMGLHELGRNLLKHHHSEIPKTRSNDHTKWGNQLETPTQKQKSARNQLWFSSREHQYLIFLHPNLFTYKFTNLTSSAWRWLAEPGHTIVSVNVFWNEGALEKDSCTFAILGTMLALRLTFKYWDTAAYLILLAGESESSKKIAKWQAEHEMLAVHWTSHMAMKDYGRKLRLLIHPKF